MADGPIFCPAKVARRCRFSRFSNASNSRRRRVFVRSSTPLQNFTKYCTADARPKNTTPYISSIAQP